MFPWKILLELTEESGSRRNHCYSNSIEFLRVYFTVGNLAFCSLSLSLDSRKVFSSISHLPPCEYGSKKRSDPILSILPLCLHSTVSFQFSPARRKLPNAIMILQLFHISRYIKGLQKCPYKDVGSLGLVRWMDQCRFGGGFGWKLGRTCHFPVKNSKLRKHWEESE